MANYLAQFQTVKNSCDRVVAAVEDVSDLWPTVKGLFEEHQPLKRALLTNNRTRNPVLVHNLPVEFILTTDARLRSRSPQEQFLFWFREPYATLLLVTCEDLDEFKNILKPRLKLIAQNDEREWFIVFVSKAHPSNDQATKSVKKVYAKLEVDFSSKKRERCCKLDIHGPNANFWEDLELKITECIRNTLDRRVLFYEDEIRKLTEQRFMPIWNFCNFFILKESLAFIFEMAHLHEDALREYDELELCYLETVNMPGKQREFGGFDSEDDKASLLKPGSKPLTQIVQDDSFREFDFRQYLFACQSRLLFKLNRPSEVSSRGYSFVISFAKALTLHESVLPFCLREVWVITACLALLDATASHHHDGIVAPDIEKEFYRLQGDLYSLARVKFMRLGYLIGYGTDIEKSPLNSACLSMLPWPKPAVWPSLPPDASSEVLEKEKTILQATSRTKHFGIQRKPLPLEPSLLLRVANRRRASLSTGNIPEIFDGRPGFTEGSGLEASPITPSSLKVQAPPMSRTNSSPGNFESPLDRPMRLAEIFVAAEHALRLTISDHDLLKALSSTQDFEHKYLNLTKGAAENYHRSWWKRHGVVLDGEIAAVCFKHGKYDLAANSYEKVCALYAGERWQDLLAEVLPNLAECQKNLNDHAGYMSSCVRLLSLDKGLFSPKERQAFQIEVVNLAHSEMENPVPLDVSSLITFSGSTGPPLQLCDGDPGTLSVTVWSGFPDDITLDSLSLTLVATNNTDEGGQALKSSAATVLKPGRNTITFALPPQKPGSYVLGVVTGQIGRLRFRSHSFSKGGPADTDDFMSYEKPTRPILKVSKPRALVDLASAVSSALLINEAQWIGIIVHPINYSLKGAILHIDTGPGLKIEDSYGIEMERYVETDCDAGTSKAEVSVEDSPVSPKQDSEVLNLCDGKIVFSEWASNVSSIMWVPVRALSEKLARGSSSVTPLKQDILEGMRTVALKLEFGVHHNQIFERTVAAHFTDPFDVTTRVVNKCNDGTMVMQVMLHSLVKANLIVLDAWLDLQEGFFHGKRDGRPTSTFFPLVVSPGSRAAVVFSISLDKTMSSGKDLQLPESILNIKYEINGDRTAGAHKPVDADHSGSDSERRALVFKSAIVLQRPVLDPCLTVGFLPLPSDGLRVGKLITMQWRVERLKELKGSEAVEQHKDEVLYEVNANSENWMIAGRKRGHVSLSEEKGSRVVISILCVPLVAGYVRPPQLSLPNVEEENVRSNPPGPHLVCVLPPLLSSSYCVPVK
ncbi:trafficking protein particle complex II-specific subunit 130 homolog isoform X1 [Brassica rapa]|uniref:trafficking protein particle complex II-specific subunit 130 homolog isoform X1 n=1 Tax=Brassica campestris TaxID=3711 RepID=UPI00142D6178|nr:trafficking protein particle complex II-specific subunit 130 homolog isoform X1 [Brassica rapa]